MNKILYPRTVCFVAAAVAVLAAMPATLRAQAAGSVASLEATVELGRSGSWAPLALGSEIRIGDRIRTDASGRVKIAFVDGSVAIVSNKSELIIDQYAFDPSKAGGSSLLELLKGRMRTIVSDYYSDAGNFDVKTPTATAGVRGTDFIVVYDSATRVTEVLGASGRVYVRSLARAAAEGVLITAGMQTTVAVGQAPTEPRAIGGQRFRDYMNDLEFIGRGRRESIGFNQPVLAGNEVPPPDRAEGSAARSASGIDLDQLQGSQGGVVPDASGLAGQPPSALDFGRVGVDF